MESKYKYFGKGVMLLVLFPLLTFCTDQKEKSNDHNELILTATEDLRIGEEKRADEYLFGDINEVVFGKDGKIVLYDGQLSIIRMYDKDGNFIKNIGRQGKGPGEYNGLGGMKAFPDGRLAIWDVRLRRISVFDENGEFIETHRVDAGLHSEDLFEIGHANEFYVKGLLNKPSSNSKWHYAWFKVSPEGEVSDTVEVPLDEEERPLTFVLFTTQGPAHAFKSWPLNTMSPKGYFVYAEDNSEYKFELRVPRDTAIQVEKEFEPVGLTPEERNQWTDWNAHYGTKNNLPETKPAFKDILTDSEGRIWVWRYVEAEYSEIDIGPHYGPVSHWWEPPTFDVFLPDGSFYATVTLPLNAKFRDAKGDQVLATYTDDTGEEYVVRYRLEEKSKP